MGNTSVMVNLSDDLIQTVVDEYSDLKDNVMQGFKNLRGNLEEIIGRTGYEALVVMANNFIEQFGNDIKDSANTQFQAWLDGEGNFHKAMELQQAGGDASSAAGEFEKKLEEIFNEIWSSNPMGDSIEADTSHPVMKDEDYDDLENIFNTAYSEFDGYVQTSVSKMTGYAQDDSSYTTAMPAFYAVTTPVMSALEAMNSKLKDFRQTNASLTSMQSQKAEAAVSEVQSNSIKAEDIASALSMFGDGEF